MHQFEDYLKQQGGTWVEAASFPFTTWERYFAMYCFMDKGQPNHYKRVVYKHSDGRIMDDEDQRGISPLNGLFILDLSTTK